MKRNGKSKELHGNWAENKILLKNKIFGFKKDYELAY
jgi:hypothetical protein